MKRVIQSATVRQSMFSDMADVLTYLDDAAELFDSVYDAMVEEHGTATKEMQDFRTWLHHTITKGEEIHRMSRFVNYTRKEK